MHNPVTNSGGMLIGRVLEIGPSFPDQGLKRGEKIATLVSLTLTPLSLEAVERVDLETGQVEVRGKAVLFASGPFARLPDDLPESVALAVLDVCGAPAQTARLVRPGQRVAVLGAGGKSGLLCLWHAKKQAGPGGRVIALEAGEAACEAIRNLALADEVIRADATRPVEVLEKVERATGGRLADVTINCVNVPHTELSSILCTRDGGTADGESQALVLDRDRLDQLDRHLDVVAGIDHLHALGQVGDAGHVGRPEVELRAVAREERRVTAALLLLQAGRPRT